MMGGWRESYRSFGEGQPLDIEVALRKVKYKRGLPVDASGVTQEGRAFKDIHEFREYLVGLDEQLARNLTERFLTFATGAGVSFADRAEVEAILNANRERRFPIRSLLEAVVLSDAFRNK